MHKLDRYINRLGAGEGVRFIELDNKRIGDEGVRALAQVMRGNQTVVQLKLSFNNITKQGVEWLAPVLGSTRIQWIHLSNNELDDAAVEVLARSLRGNIHLELLTLSGNYRISEKSTTVFLDAVKGNDNRKLQTLDLGFPLVSVPGKELKWILNRNQAASSPHRATNETPSGRKDETESFLVTRSSASSKFKVTDVLR